MWRIVLGMLIGLSLVGCGKRPGAENLPGTYIADYGYATDILLVRADGTFKQIVNIKGNSTPRITNGTWEYEFSLGYFTLSTEHFSVTDNRGRFNPDLAHRPGVSIMPAKVFLGRVQIDDDPSVPYYKVGTNTN
jgi:hypothetical protein